jgi:hypothetical protein
MRADALAPGVASDRIGGPAGGSGDRLKARRVQPSVRQGLRRRAVRCGVAHEALDRGNDRGSLRWCRSRSDQRGWRRWHGGEV